MIEIGGWAMQQYAQSKQDKMDRELAGAIIDRWDSGQPVSETQLYKAAQVIGIDPMAALVEARFYTYLDKCLLEKRAMSRGERIVFSAASGMSDGPMIKSAAAYGFSPEELIVEALRARDFVPDIEKIANIAPMMGQQQPGGKPPGPGQPPVMDPSQGGVDPEQQAAGVMMAPPDPNAVLQQQPGARIKPSPTGPEQIAASPGGNLDELIQQGQQVFGDQATQNGGAAPQGMPEPPPEPPSPEERIRQVGPNLDDETVARYAEQLARFEEGFQMQIADPKQMVKFVKELQKVDGKKIDQGIKAMSQQLEQEQAQELGVDATPTIDGPGGAGGGGPGTRMAPKQEGAPQNMHEGLVPDSQETGNAPQSPGGGQGSPQDPQKQPTRPPRPQPKAAPQQAADPAVEKVANAARALARAGF